MDESNKSKPAAKSTIEIYRDLLEVEFKTLLHRVTEVTNTIAELFIEVNSLAVRLEHTEISMEDTKIKHSNEIANLKKVLTNQNEIIDTLHKTISAIGKKQESKNKE